LNRQINAMPLIIFNTRLQSLKGFYSYIRNIIVFLINFLLAGYVLAHHERWDGTGYPKGLQGKEIPIGARIIALASSYDAMTSERPYRNALSEEKVLAEIRNSAGTQFDPEIAIIFIGKVLCKE